MGLIAVMIVSCKEDTETVHLVVSNHNPSGTTPALMTDLWAETVTERSDGRIALEVHHDADLMSEEEVFESVKTGIVDIGLYVLDASNGFKLNTVISLPFMGWPGQQEAALLYEDLLNQFPEMKDEWGTLTILAMSVMPGTHMHFVDQNITTPSELEGVRMMSAQPMTSDAMKAAQAIPVELEINEMGSALDNGTIDGIIDHFPVLDVFGVVRRMSYHLVFGEGGINMTPIFIITNNSVLNDLDDDLSEIIMSAGDVFQDTFIQTDATMDEAARQKVVNAGLTITELTAEEIEVWRGQIAQTVHDEWIAAAEADDLPGQEVYDEVWNRLH